MTFLKRPTRRICPMFLIPRYYGVIDGWILFSNITTIIKNTIKNYLIPACRPLVYQICVFEIFSWLHLKKNHLNGFELINILFLENFKKKNLDYKFPLIWFRFSCLCREKLRGCSITRRDSASVGFYKKRQRRPQPGIVLSNIVSILLRSV